MIFILDRQEQVIGLLKNGGVNSGAAPFYDDLLTEDLATGAETFQFTTIMGNDTASDLCVGNYVAFKKDDKMKLFQIMQTSEDHSQEMEMTVYAESAGLGLINQVVRKQKLISSTLRRFMTTVLDGTEWKLGKCPTIEQSYDIEIEDDSVYSVLQNNLSKYGVEIEFRVELKKGRVSDKYIDLHETRGNVTGKRFEFGKDIEGLSRKTDATELYTALIGKGKDGLTFRDVSVSGINKPKGQDYVADQAAFDRYNNNGYHIMGVFEYDTESPEELLRETYKQLQKSKNPKIEYEVNVALLGELLGQDWNTVAIGDTVYIVDNYFNPPVHLAARVNKLETSMTDPQNDKCVLANFVEVKSNITDAMRKIAAKLEGYVDNSIGSKFPVTSENIANGAITQDKIVEYSIETKHLKADSITAEKIKANEIQAKHISANQIETKHLQADSIDADKIKANSITAEKIKANEITADHLQSNTITADKIATGTITADSGVIQNGAITNALIAHGAIESANIKEGEIGTAHIKDGAIDSAKIGEAAIGSAHIEDAAITNAKIDSLSADKISGGQIDAEILKSNVIEAINASIGKIDATHIDTTGIKAESIDAENITGTKIDTKILQANIIEAINGSFEDLKIENAKIGFVSADKIKGGHIDAELLSATVIEAINASIGKIDAEHIDVGSIKVENIDAGMITGGDIDMDRIKANVISAINAYAGEMKIKQGQIETLQVGNANIIDGTISGAKIENGSITNAQIQDATIDSAKIKEIYASQIKSGTVETGELDISSIDGSLTMKGNTIQIKDNQPDKKVRVQIGKDARNQYGILVFNANGQPIFDSERGVLAPEGLSDDVVSASKIVNGAVGPDKLNLQELFVEDNAFIQNLKAVEIDASRITTGFISNERINMKGLVAFETFNEELKDLIFPVLTIDENGNKVYDKTYINGGNISTGSIKADSIDLLSGINVRGLDGMTTFSVSSEGNVEVNGLLKSGNYDENRKTGYKIDTNGIAILNQATIRGTVELENAGMTNSDLHENATRIWAGSNYDGRDDAPFRVTQKGDLFATNATIRGKIFGSLDSGQVHVHDKSITLNRVHTTVDDQGVVRTFGTSRDLNEDAYVDLNTEFCLFNNDVFFGTVDQKNFIYSNQNNYIDINNIDFTVNGGTTSITVEKEDGFQDGVNYAARKNWNGGNLTMGYAGGTEVDNAAWRNTFIMTSKGSKGMEYGDICMRREDVNEDIDVRIQGNLQIKNRIKGSNHNIEMRCVDDEGWGFYIS
ncbi:MAG TPA: hypothetical protein DCW90_06195 [Lachnospiraceae bacterium]|nr:phage tail spike protein [uncultured Lachnoclostridium sp.]HAU85088.1 hypothetical protein [Lachnospiraceae bacterium]